MRFLTDEERAVLAGYRAPYEIVMCSSEPSFDIAVPDIDVSVVIPCYNAGEYLRESLDSLCAQKTDCVYEIIVVNDGSTDNSSEILAEYAERYPVLRAVTQKNSGGGSARNAGMRLSRGRYLAFVDADDRVGANYIDALFKAASENHADMSACGYLTFLDSGTVIKRVTPSGSSDTGILIGTPWAKLFDRRLFEHLRWPEKGSHQDTIIAWLVFPRVQKAVTTAECCYEYRSNAAGITSTSKKTTKAIDTLYMTDSVLAALETAGLGEWAKTEDFYRSLIDQFYLNHYRIRYLDRSIRQLAFKVQCRFVAENCKELAGSKTAHPLYSYALRTGSFITADIAAKANKLGKLVSMIKSKLKKA